MFQKKTICILLAVLLLAVTAAQAGGLPTIGGGGTGSFNQTGGAYSGDYGSSHTVMIYLVGSNLESEYGEASQDLMEIANCGYNFSKVNVVVAAGGSASWKKLSVQPGEVAFGSMVRQRDGTVALEWQKRQRGSIADSSMFTSFLNYAYNNYPAENYTLVLWDHGGGPLVGFGHDEISDEIMSLEDMVKGLKNSPFARKKLSVLNFDACLMASYEVAAAMAPYAEYMVASEEVSYGYGFSWLANQHMIQRTAAMSVARDICDGYAKRSGYHREYSISVIDLGAMARLTNTMDSVFQEKNINADRTAVARAATYAKAFGASGSDYNYDLYDLHEYMYNLCYLWGVSNTSEVLYLIDRAVNYNLSNIAGANGISFYYPLYTQPSWYDAAGIYNRLGLSSSYRKYMQTVKTTQVQQVGGNSTMRGARSLQRIQLPNRTVSEDGPAYTMQLTPEQQENYVRASYVIVTPAEDGRYDLVRGGYGAEVDENGLLTVHVSPNIAATGSEEKGWQYVTLVEKERTDSQIRYFLPFLLERGEHPQMANAQYILEEGVGELHDIVPSSINGLAPRHLLSFEPGDWVSYQILSYQPAYAEDGSLLPFNAWKLDNSVYATGFTVSETEQVTIAQVPATDREYYVQITAVDVDGNRVCSELMPLRTAD